MSDDVAQTEFTSPLEYAPQPAAWAWRRRRRKWIVLVALLAGAAFVGWVKRRDVERLVYQGRLLYAQHRCLTFDPPGERVVYEEDAAKVVGLLSDSHYRPALGADGKPKAALWWPEVARGWPEMSRYEWVPGRSGMIFMHELKTPKGRRLLVFATAEYPEIAPDAVDIRVQAVEPATWRRRSNSAHGIAAGFIKPPLDRTSGLRQDNLPPVRIYAGRLDPTDASRFTANYEGGGHRGYMEVRVLDGDDGQSLTIEWGCRTTGWDRQ